jgi:hypothetical protein
VRSLLLTLILKSKKLSTFHEASMFVKGPTTGKKEPAFNLI